MTSLRKLGLGACALSAAALAGLGLGGAGMARANHPGGAMVEVTVPALSPEAQAGAQRFTAACAACHGTAGAGNDMAGPPLIHKIYEPGHHGDAAFFYAALGGVRAHHWRFGDMPPVAGVTENDVALILSYIRELQRANGIF